MVLVVVVVLVRKGHHWTKEYRGQGVVLWIRKKFGEKQRMDLP